MMADIAILDTSVLLNVFDVPGFNQERVEIYKEFRAPMDAGASFLLPMAAVFETGNHIRDLSDGRLRRRYAEKFRDEIRKALAGKAPWIPIRFPDRESLSQWIEEFPDHAMREIGMSNLSIIKDWEVMCKRHGNRRVRIWSLKRRLQSYDQGS